MYHVVSRGNHKATIFHDDEDRRQFLRVVSSATRFYELQIKALCLMGTHYHIVLETPESNLSDAMHFINGVFAQRYNRRYRQTGHLFEGRFRSLVIQRESYLMRVARYVVRNPVRAGMVERAANWQWSSYRATAGLERPPRWLDVYWIQDLFKARSLREAREKYVHYVNAPASSQRAVNLNGLVLGTKSFERRVARAVADGAPDRVLPRKVRMWARPSLAELFDAPVNPVVARDRLIYRARVEHGHRFVDIARHLGIDRSTASKAAKRYQPPIEEYDG
jgi:REP element-mobilizing transposase RayT